MSKVRNGRHTETIEGNEFAFWYEDNILHREDGPAVESSDGYKAWKINGEYHRVGGPAVVHANGDKDWYLRGVQHREDGPAFEASNGYREWWINGEELTEDEFNAYLAKKKLNEALQSDLEEKETKGQHKL
ncbi:hypothetical protein KTE71_28870 [Burkholderia multivorans]|uniref:hypothetical protein n=1 Tax=Burkholderia multivorans TaxID=87883 RepID=UPI001C257258|nr:hypothetical protein [Burkholderia multivorans]MBU9391509.1 hypothetical protein [Burkholderia multivorans]